jgi:hypothetical protein
MGVAVGDYDNNGFLDLYVTHFAHDWNTLYRNLGPEGFHDVTGLVGLVEPTLPVLGFGTVMADFDQDGDAELFVANGHIDDLRERGDDLEMPQQLFEFHSGRWTDCGAHAGDYFQRRFVGRGTATCDYDNDGDLDLVVVHQNAETVLLRNDSQRGHWLKVEVVGRQSNRRGIGTRVTVKAGSTTVMQELVGGASYCASPQPVLTFGLGQSSGRCSLEIRWPSGQIQSLDHVAPDQFLRLAENLETNPDKASPNKP